MFILFPLLIIISQITNTNAFQNHKLKYKATTTSLLKLKPFMSINSNTQDSNDDNNRIVINDNEQDYDRDAALIKRLNDEILAESGVELDQLINPSKVVNLERDIENLNIELEGINLTEEMKTEILSKIEKKKSVLYIEKRSVMRGWLKTLFVGQSILAIIISLGMVYDVIPGYHLPLALQVLGFWMWWLFIIPSLRARKPQAAEKEALNIAFVASPIVSIIAPTFTKDVALIWWINAFVTSISYGYGYATIGINPSTSSSQDVADTDIESELENKSVLPRWIRQAIKALDYGSGQERGLRK